MDLPLDVDALRGVLRAQGIVFAVVFGSYADGTPGPTSDVDLAVWGPAPVDDWALRAQLPDVVDVVDLRTAPQGIAGRIAMTGRPLLDDHPPTRIRWQAQTLKRHLDEAGRRERFRQDFVAAHG